MICLKPHTLLMDFVRLACNNDGQGWYCFEITADRLSAFCRTCQGWGET